MKHLLWLLFAVLTTPVLAQPIELQSGTIIDWSGDGPLDFTHGGYRLRIEIVGPTDGDRVATLVVDAPGLVPVRVDETTVGTGWGRIGVIPFDDKGNPSIIYGVHSGGAHCCTQLSAVTEVEGTFLVSAIASVDTDAIEPSDIDGDGTMELDLPDDRFNYEFDSFAGSWPPRLVFKARDGEVYDASAEPRYAPLYERELEAARAQCSGEGEWSYAACAAMLASAVRLGRFEEVYRPMAEAFRSGAATGAGWGDFSVCPDEACAERIDLTSFADAVVLKLAEWGYIDWAMALEAAEHSDDG
jgi:hypothetical protein